MKVFQGGARADTRVRWVLLGRETKAMRVMVDVKVNELADARVSANFG